MRYLRRYFDQRGFTEVETPILSGRVGGASARPFETQSHALNAALQLRISPELHLKQLVVGGIEKVYEIGKQFRNEGIDATHYPEFTMLESYEAYASVEDLFQSVEALFRDLVSHFTGQTNSSVWMDGEAVPVDFSTPFRRIQVLPTLKRELGIVDWPDLEGPESAPFLVAQLSKHGISLPSPTTVPKLLDRLTEHFIEPACVQPTFICSHALVSSPLAKGHSSEVSFSVIATCRFLFAK